MMYKQSSFRNHRSKGIKVRHVLQICLLLAVCFWLIYQVKHSHDKKNEYDDTDDDKASLERSISDEGLRLGRKDIRSRVEETAYNNEKHDESDENIQEDEDENKLDEDGTTSHEKADVGEEDEATEGENEEIDEHEREGSDAELDREEEFVDDEKEKQGGDNVAEEIDSDAEKIRIEKDNESDSDGVDKSTHDAHEELYKADDASSAVSQTHDTHEKPSAENESLHSKDMLEVKHKRNDDVEDANKVDLEIGASKDGKESNITTSDNNVLTLDNSENGSPPNGTVTQGVEDTFTGYNSTEVAINNRDSSALNVTENDNKLDHGMGNLNETTSNEVSISDTVASGLMNNSMLSEDNNGRDATRDLESNSESAPERFVTSEEASAETHNNTELSTKVKVEIEGERSDTSNSNTEESLKSTYNPNIAEHDSIDLSDLNNTLEETDVTKDIDTLSVIQNEGTADDATAAE